MTLLIVAVVAFLVGCFVGMNVEYALSYPDNL